MCIRDSPKDDKMGPEIKSIAADLMELIQDDDLLEERRKDVVQFRSSISSPGRKSTDNSHLKNIMSPGENVVRSHSTSDRREDGIDRMLRPLSPDLHTGARTANYRSGTTSLDLKRRPVRNTNEYARFNLDPLKEEDTVPDERSELFKSRKDNVSKNPFR